MYKDINNAYIAYHDCSSLSSLNDCVDLENHLTEHFSLEAISPCCKRLLFLGNPPSKLRHAIEKSGGEIDYIDIHVERNAVLGEKLKEAIKVSPYCAIIYIANRSKPWINLRGNELSLIHKIAKQYGYNEADNSSS